MNGYAQHPQPGPSRPSPYSSPPQAPAVYPGYQQPAGYAPYPSPLPNGSPYRHVEAVPAPQPKVAYEPPVFRTFQDRKRAKDAALRAQAGALDTPAASEAAASLSYTVARPPVQLPRTTSIPDRSTLAMMGRPTDGRPPAPPIRNTRSPTIDNPLVSTSASTQNALPSPALRAHPLPHPTSRPLPSPAPSLTGSSSSHTSPSLPISPTSSQAASIYSVDRPIERSDTLASVKSVDRVGFSVSRRPLPQTPVGVNSSKSLDRGMAAGYSGMGDGFRRDMKIRQPSAVSEDSNEGSLVESLTGLGLRANSPTISSTTLPLIDPVDPQSMPPSKDASGQSAVVVPIIAFPDHDDDGPPSISFHTPADEPEPPGFTFSGPPTISVSSEDVDDPGPLSITVPAIQLPDDGETSSPLASPALTPQDGSALLCAGCDHPIIGRIVNAMKKRFHPACFKCDECGELLEHVSSYEWEGKAFCHLDYHDVRTARRAKAVTDAHRNSLINATSARHLLWTLASSHSAIPCSVSGFTTSYTSSAASAEIRFSTLQHRLRQVQSKIVYPVERKRRRVLL